MNRRALNGYDSRFARRLTKWFALLFSIVFIVSIHVPLYAITVEEQAGKREREKYRSYRDELSRKVPERRDARQGRQEKDPRLACLLSLMVPGGGHIYLRRDLKGMSFCLLTAGFYSASAYYLYVAWKGDSSGTERKSKFVISGVLFIVGAIFHVVGIVEAYNDAIEINETKFYYGKKRSRSPYVARIQFQ